MVQLKTSFHTSYLSPPGQMGVLQREDLSLNPYSDIFLPV